jgi:segregation and condensation protein B
MRKKRKLAARAARKEDLETPELVEAVEAQAIAAELAVAAEEDQIEEARIARVERIVESLLFATDKPLTVARLKQLAHERTAARVEASLARLSEHYQRRGIVLHCVAGGYQFRTHPDCSEWVQQLVAGRPVRLSRPQLETLAIIAYRQPITRPEIDDIRGVDSGGTLHILLERNLIRVLGKREEPGRPLLYGTTKEFLEFFNLRDLKELPTLREFYELNEESVKKLQELDARRAAEGLPAAAGPHAPAEGEASAAAVVDEAAERSESSPA